MARGPGFFERAHRGTLFLDEIGELSATLQAKLLAVLEDRSIYRVGSPDPVEVDVRVIAATNRDLAKEVREGRFRADLFHRLAILRFTRPRLRDRRGDVPRLIGYWLDRIAEENGGSRPAVEPEAMERLMAYTWPGNIRELGHVLRSAYAYARGEAIGLRHLDSNRLSTAQHRQRRLIR